ncbi:MAG: sigma-70 family RNA polymerase sigma factor [Bryobacterales bacterium]|nr:sigma-70 family RNA polymerase sigma factor [Bryobacterales bacterium]
MQPEDEQLIRGFLAGEPAVVARIERWVTAAGRSFRPRLESHWEDVRQEVMAELTRLFREQRFRGESALVSYVWRISNHACIRQLRRQQRWSTGGQEMLEERRDPAQTVAERMLERDRMTALERVVSELGEECRKLLRRILAGESYEAMSEALGLAAGTLRVRVLRCRRKAMELREKGPRA